MIWLKARLRQIVLSTYLTAVRVIAYIQEHASDEANNKWIDAYDQYMLSLVIVGRDALQYYRDSKPRRHKKVAAFTQLMSKIKVTTDARFVPVREIKDIYHAVMSGPISMFIDTFEMHLELDMVLKRVDNVNISKYGLSDSYIYDSLRRTIYSLHSSLPAKNPCAGEGIDNQFKETYATTILTRKFWGITAFFSTMRAFKIEYACSNNA